MNASRASASVEVAACLGAVRRVLICGVNWLGDSVMAMPALNALRSAYPAAHWLMLAQSALAPLWRLDPGFADLLVLERGAGGTWRAVQAVRGAAPELALILPHSFRSALIPFAARVPLRIGLPGHGRDWMLTHCVAPPADARDRHQACEYWNLFGLPATDSLPEPPFLRLPPAALEQTVVRWPILASAKERPLIALFPGAARGPAKRWPLEHFIALGRRLAAERQARILALGSAAETGLCAQVAAAIGAGAVSLAGQTALPDLAAVLAHCALAVANDSGGMHLAVAVGVPVVGIFGLTDPAKTGPLGAKARVVCAADRGLARDIPRKSAAAAAALRSIPPETVYRAALALLPA
jgi:heptosyltransferase-2